MYISNPLTLISFFINYSAVPLSKKGNAMLVHLCFPHSFPLSVFICLLISFPISASIWDSSVVLPDPVFHLRSSSSPPTTEFKCNLILTGILFIFRHLLSLLCFKSHLHWQNPRQNFLWEHLLWRHIGFETWQQHKLFPLQIWIVCMFWDDTEWHRHKNNQTTERKQETSTPSEPRTQSWTLCWLLCKIKGGSSTHQLDLICLIKIPLAN